MAADFPGNRNAAEGKITDVADHIVMFCACAWLWWLPRISYVEQIIAEATGYQ